MKIRQIGQKIATFGKTLGSKIEHGVRTLGQKVYDNRYKLLAGAAGIASVAALGYAGNKMMKANANTNQARDDRFWQRIGQDRTKGNPIYDNAVNIARQRNRTQFELSPPMDKN